MIVLRVHNKMIMSCLHPNINRMLNFYGIKIRQVIEYFFRFSLAIGHTNGLLRKRQLNIKWFAHIFFGLLILESMTQNNCTFHECYI